MLENPYALSYFSRKYNTNRKENNLPVREVIEVLKEL